MMGVGELIGAVLISAAVGVAVLAGVRGVDWMIGRFLRWLRDRGDV